MSEPPEASRQRHLKMREELDELAQLPRGERMARLLDATMISHNKTWNCPMARVHITGFDCYETAEVSFGQFLLIEDRKNALREGPPNRGTPRTTLEDGLPSFLKRPPPVSITRHETEREPTWPGTLGWEVLGIFSRLEWAPVEVQDATIPEMEKLLWDRQSATRRRVGISSLGEFCALLIAGYQSADIRLDAMDLEDASKCAGRFGHLDFRDYWK